MKLIFWWTRNQLEDLGPPNPDFWRIHYEWNIAAHIYVFFLFYPLVWLVLTWFRVNFYLRNFFMASIPRR